MLSHEGLGEEGVRDVLARAQEIEARLQGPHDDLVQAAEESGLSRAAVEQALQERLGLLGSPPAVGDLVFARAEGDKFHPAEVVEADGRDMSVRFLNGETRRVPFESLRPLNLMPGERLVCPWPDWGWWNCTVIAYNPDGRTVKVTDNWGSEKEFDLAQVYRTGTEKAPKGLSPALLGLYVSAAGLVGGAIGSLLTWLAMR